MTRHQKYYAVIFALYSLLAVAELLNAGKTLFVLSAVFVCLIAVVSFLTIVFFYAHAKKRYDYIDIAWGPAIGIAVWVSYNMSPFAYANTLSSILIACVAIWALRLSFHIGVRTLGGKTEDQRYVNLRKHWKGNVAFNVYTRVFLVQAVLATIIAIPLIHINLFDGNTWTYFAVIGIVMWVCGLVIETIADHQLRRFIQTHKKGLMTDGLWRYSRHPNYFGELLQWWGFGVVAMGVYPWWIGLIGPLTISYLIIFVSGIPLLEARFEQKKGWQDYKNRTSILVPWFVKR